MPTANAALVYRTSVFANGAAIAAVLGAAPLNTAILGAFGLLLKTDVTVAGVRTVNLGLVPTVAATATAQLQPGATPSGSPVVGLTLTAPGSGFSAVPPVVITNAAGDTTGKGAKARASLDVASVTLGAGGNLYAGPTVALVGGLAPGGVAATVTATFVPGGAITGFTVVTPGSGYNGIPQVVITDPLGAGATGTAVLQVATLTVTNGGVGYQAPPTVLIESLFKMLFPDGPNQRAPLNNLFTAGLQEATLLQIVADAPVIT